MKITNGNCGNCGSLCNQAGGICQDCQKGGQVCVSTGQPNAKYSILGGVVAPKDSASVMPSMSNPNAERPTNRIDTSLPSLRDRGSISNMDNFNPYSRKYENRVVQRNIASIPQTYGEQKFYTNVKLEGHPVGSPILSKKGTEVPSGQPVQARESWGCPRTKCKRPRGFLRQAEKVPCIKKGGRCVCTFNDGTEIGCGRDSRTAPITNYLGY